MTIAIPVDEKQKAIPHTGRCAGFLLYDLDGDQVITRRFVEHDSPHPHHEQPHAQGSHHHQGIGQGSTERRGGHGGHHHSILSSLKGVDLVIALGMGPRLEEAFRQAGIRVAYTRLRNPQAIVEQVRRGAFESDPRGSVCNGSHHDH